jgi:hypothetical protein
MEAIGAILVVCEHVVEVDHAVELVLLLFGLRSQFIAQALPTSTARSAHSSPAVRVSLPITCWPWLMRRPKALLPLGISPRRQLSSRIQPVAYPSGGESRLLLFCEEVTIAAHRGSPCGKVLPYVLLSAAVESCTTSSVTRLPSLVVRRSTRCEAVCEVASRMLLLTAALAVGLTSTLSKPAALEASRSLP